MKEIKDNGVKVSLFVDPDIDQIQSALDINADAVEIHTGKFSPVF